MKSHPSSSELVDFLRGKLPLKTSESLSDHLAECDPCQATLQDLRIDGDTLLAGLRGKPVVDPIDDELRRAMTAAAELVLPSDAADEPSESTIAFAQSNVAEPQDPPLDRERFLTLLSTAQVLEPGRRPELDQDPELVRAADGAELARRLVELGLLTAYQAEQLLRNRIENLVYGEYLVLAPIKVGGMGQVFTARHRRMDRVVALKVMAKRGVGSPEAVHRFEREMKAAAKLIHPNIVTAFDAGSWGDAHYLVMEYIDGKDLADLVSCVGPISCLTAVRYVRQAAQALAFAHSKGIIHRDVKPGNLMVDSAGVVRILDLGLARLDGDAATRAAAQGLTQEGQIMGTVDYMAPEQAFDTRTADAKVDTYALGCTLYRLLTAEIPFAAETLVQKLLAHREHPVPSLAEKCPTVPPQLAALFSRMVAKRPEQRPTMAEVVVELEAIELVMSTSAETPYTVIASPKPAEIRTRSSGGRRPPRRLLVAAAGGCLFLLFGVWFIVRDPEGKEIARVQAPTGSTIEAQPDRTEPAPSGTKPVAPRPTPTEATQNQATPNATALTATVSTVAPPPALPVPKLGELRTWTSFDGVFKVEAAFVGTKPDGRVVIKQGSNGKMIEVQLAQLGAADQAYVKSHATPAATALAIATVAGSVAPVVLNPIDNPLAGILPSPAKLPGLGRWNVETTDARHTGGVPAWSADGKWLAITGDRSQVRVYEVEGKTKKLKHILPRAYHDGGFDRVSWNPDGTRLAVGGRNADVRIWDLSANAPRVLTTISQGPTFPTRENVLAWSPDGSVIAISKFQKIELRDPATGELKATLQGHSNEIQALAWRGDGLRLASVGNDRRAIIWDVAEAKGLQFLTKHSGNLGSLAWSPDGRRLATGGGHDSSNGNNKVVSVWNAETGEIDFELSPETGSVSRAIAWDPGGAWILTGNYPPILWRADDGTQLRQLPLHGFNFLAVNPRTGIIAGAMGAWHALLDVADTARNEEVRFPGIKQFSWNSDSRRIAASTMNKLVTLIPTDPAGAVKWLHPDVQHVDGIMWTEDNRSIVGFDSFMIQKWDIERDKPMSEVRGLDIRKAVGPVRGAHVVGSFDRGSREIKIWDCAKMKQARTLLGQNEEISGLTMSDDGKRIASYGKEFVRVWDVENGTEVGAFRHPCMRAKLSPQGDRLILVEHNVESTVTSLSVVDMLGKTVFPLECRQAGFECAWSPDGRFIVGFEHEEPRGAILCDATTGRRIRTVPFEGAQYEAKFDPTSRMIAIASSHDSSLHLLEAETGRWLRTTTMLPNARTATFLPTGELFASDTTVEDEIVYVVEVENGGFETLTPQRFRERLGRTK